MIEWVLVMLLAGAPAVEVPFASRAACERAKALVLEVNALELRKLTVTCVLKGVK